MLHGGHTHIAALKYSAAVGLCHILGQGVDYRFALEVDALNFVAVVLGCREETGLYFQACMKAFTFDGKVAFECELFHIWDVIFFIFFSNSATRATRAPRFLMCTVLRANCE